MAAETGGDLIINHDYGAALTQYTALQETSGNTYTALTAALHKGTHGARMTFAGSSAICDGYYVFSPTLNLRYARAYIRFPSGSYPHVAQAAYETLAFGPTFLQPSAAIICLPMFVARSTAPTIVFLGVYHSSSIYQAGSPQPTLAVDTWHRVEIYWAKGASANGILSLWINGVQCINLTTITYNYDITYVMLGSGATVDATLPAAGQYMDQDSLKVATTPIRAYPNPLMQGRLVTPVRGVVQLTAAGGR